MKKRGILNAQLIGQIAALGHFDSFVLCDMGFPIPRGAVVVDLALMRGVPNMRQTLQAVLEETVVQQVVLVDAAQEANPALVDHVRQTCCKQELTFATFSEFRERALDAKFFVRTAEDAPCSNLLLVSASGVLERVEKYSVD